MNQLFYNIAGGIEHQIRREKRTAISEVIVRVKRNIMQIGIGFISSSRFTWDSVKCGCGRRTADGGRRMADGGCGRRTKQTIKTKRNYKKKTRNKYKNKDNQLTIKKRKRHVEISPGTRRLYFHNKNDNY